MNSEEQIKLEKFQEILDKSPERITALWCDGSDNLDIAIEGVMDIEAIKVMGVVLEEVHNLFEVDIDTFGAFPFNHSYVVGHEGGYLVERAPKTV